MRKEGHKVGLIKFRCLRPFPVKELQQAVKNLKGLAVIDRHVSLGFEGPLATDVKGALYDLKSKPIVAGFIAGLGGRDITIDRLEKALKNVMEKKDGEWLH
jgi:pyruvate ferredoxin oxidoreductase alpha subunit